MESKNLIITAHLTLLSTGIHGPSFFRLYVKTSDDLKPGEIGLRDFLDCALLTSAILQLGVPKIQFGGLDRYIK